MNKLTKTIQLLMVFVLFYITFGVHVVGYFIHNNHCSSSKVSTYENLIENNISTIHKTDLTDHQPECIVCKFLKQLHIIKSSKLSNKLNYNFIQNYLFILIAITVLHLHPLKARSPPIFNS